MAVKACLNGARTRSEHLAVPQTSSELAVDAIAVARAGAFAVHVHPRTAGGAQTMNAAACDAAVGAIRAGVPGMPVGLSTPADAEELVRSPFAHQLVRALVEVDGGVEEARAVARLVPEGVPQLWHGYGHRTWEVVAAGAAAGHDVRVGLEDVLTLPNGAAVASNAELVATAVRLIVSEEYLAQ